MDYFISNIQREYPKAYAEFMKYVQEQLRHLGSCEHVVRDVKMNNCPFDLQAGLLSGFINAYTKSAGMPFRYTVMVGHKSTDYYSEMKAFVRQSFTYIEKHINAFDRKPTLQVQGLLFNGHGKKN